MNEAPSFTLFLCRVLPLGIASWLVFAFITHLALNLYQYLTQ